MKYNIKNNKKYINSFKIKLALNKLRYKIQNQI